MTTWETYQKTMTNDEDEVFEFSRQGDLNSILKISLSPDRINQKNSQGHSLLMLAAYHGHQDLTDYLLSQGADPNSYDKNGNSILMGVAFKGNLEILKSLLKAGADISYKSPKGQTALDFAEMFGRRKIAQLLTKKRVTRLSQIASIFSSWTYYFFRSVEPFVKINFSKLKKS